MDDPPFSAAPFETFGPDALLACYARGVFPMAEARDDDRVFLVEPDLRGVIPLDAFRISSRLKRTVRAERFEIRTDTAFVAVVDACAAPGPGRQDTWINAPIRRLYRALHERGDAHSLECWRDGRLAGGLYGVSLGGAFFGESMFSGETDASKVALVHLVARLRLGRWRLLDAQFQTPHLAMFGAVETPQAAYLRRLRDALKVTPDKTALTCALSGEDAVRLALAGGVGANVGQALQRTTQAS